MPNNIFLVFYVVVLLILWYGFHAMICYRLATAKGRKWYLYVLLGCTLSIFGLLIVLAIPPRKQKFELSDGDRTKAAGVKLLWANAPEPHKVLDKLEFELATPGECEPPSLDYVADRIRIQAADVGGNAVCQTELTRSRPRFWTIRPRHVWKSHGVCVSLGRQAYQQVESDAVEVANVLDENPQEALLFHQMEAGIASMVWAILNAGFTYGVVSERGTEAVTIPPVYIYALSGWLFIEGILVLAFRGRIATLIVDGLTIIAIGVLNIVGGGFGTLLGVFQIGWGLKSIGLFLEFTNRIRQYKEQLAKLEARRSK